MYDAVFYYCWLLLLLLVVMESQKQIPEQRDSRQAATAIRAVSFCQRTDDG
jgi:hypothetical protein